MIAFLDYGFKSSNYKIVCLAIDFCRYLDTIPDNIKDQILKCPRNENLYVQEYTVELIIGSKINIPYADNFISTYTLIRSIVKLFIMNSVHFLKKINRRLVIGRREESPRFSLLNFHSHLRQPQHVV